MNLDESTEKPAACSCLCECEEVETRYVFPCSGAADVGEVADRAARELSRRGVADMYCLAGISGRVSGIVATTRAASKILAIDGCPQDCVRKTLELAGFTGFRHLKLHEIGLAKKQSPANDENIRRVIDAAMAALQS